jgi:tRNA threonylcarbamoyladenosine biosynthesis protein TsaB
VAKLLFLETATSVCSVALSEDETLLSIRESNSANSHAEKITVFIEEVLKESNTHIKNLDAVIVSKGPGSYTGLRIGVSTAKALCFSLDIPVISTDTLLSIANGMKIIHPELFQKDITVCPMIDARRMEVYCALFDNRLNKIKDTEAIILTEAFFEEFTDEKPLIIAGDGSAKCQPLITGNKNITEITGFNLSSRFMIQEGWHKFSNKIFENTAYFEPYYLKEFVAGKPKVKGL